MAIENKKEFNYDNYDEPVFTKLEKCINNIGMVCGELSENIRENRVDVEYLEYNLQYLNELYDDIYNFQELKYGEKTTIKDQHILDLRMLIIVMLRNTKDKLSYLKWIEKDNIKNKKQIKEVENYLVSLKIYHGE